MQKVLRDGYKQLLLAQPFWASLRDRRAFLHDLFSGHQILHELPIDGAPSTVASELLDLCDTFSIYPIGSLSPLCAMLEEIKRVGALNDELKTVFADLQRELCPVRESQDKPKWRRAPYPGLNYFDRDDAPIFFGREAEAQELIDKLVSAPGQRMTIVTGSSGSGKSSVVRAGLWAQLAEGRVPKIPQSGAWLITAMTPSDWGSEPLRALLSSIDRARRETLIDLSWFNPGNVYEQITADSNEDLLYQPQVFNQFVNRIRSHGPNAEWLLILDQMEELFTPDFVQTGPSFIELLLEATKNTGFRIVATIRSDFISHCVDHPGLRAVLNRGGQFNVGSPDRLALEQMVSGPINDVDLLVTDTEGKLRYRKVDLDPELAPRIALEAAGQPGGLALMAFALRELYERCERGHGGLNMATFQSEDFGGLGGAIARRAEQVFEELGTRVTDIIPRLFAPLVHVRDQDGVATRRSEPISTWRQDPEVKQLIEALTRARLLVKRGRRGHLDSVEVAHEALLQVWPRLRDWISDQRDAFILRNRVLTEAHAWIHEDPHRHSSRPWSDAMIEDVRIRLRGSGHYEHITRDWKVALLLARGTEWLLAKLCCEALDHKGRRDIGNRLEQLGDSRAGVGVTNNIPVILWREVPAGKIECHGEFVFNRFWIAAYPITVAQFRTFLRAEDGYVCNDWWEDLEKEKRCSAWDTGPANHPITRVSWCDATAYCRWLTTRLGYEVRLPDIWEWQWAAQSARSTFRYPWGSEWQDNYVNSRESGIYSTMAVGMYPNGASTQGVHDLVGNVWEWCRKDYEDLEQTASGGIESRALCGSSWYFDMNFVNEGGHCPPELRNADIGFRLVRSARLNDQS